MEPTGQWAGGGRADGVMEVLRHEQRALRMDLRPGRDAASEGGSFRANCGGALLNDEETVGRGVVDFEVDAKAPAVGTVVPADHGQDGFIIEETDALHLNLSEKGV